MCNLPFVSVIIPVKNDPYGIQKTLRSLFMQTYPQKKYEVIVVDNNSEDNTFSMIQKTVAEFEGNAIVETEKAKGSYAARNKGIRVSSGDIIAFIDSDMTVGAEWILKGVQCFADKKADYIGCNMDVFSLRKKLSIWEKYHIALGFPVKEYMAIDGYAPTACLFIKRKVIKTVGLFDPRLTSGGDCEFGTRVRDQGFKMYYDHDNVMNHPARDSFSSLLKKQKRVTMGQIRLRSLYSERFSCNRFKDIAMCCIQLLPLASPGVIKKISRSMIDFFPLLVIFYVLRLYTCGLKLVNRSIF